MLLLMVGHAMKDADDDDNLAGDLAGAVDILCSWFLGTWWASPPRFSHRL
jgi:hypothetical protein